jgi:hypothetical protein
VRSASNSCSNKQRIDLLPNLIETVTAQNAVLFPGASASYGATHPMGKAIPSGFALRDQISDRFHGGELKDRSLSEVAELADSESSLITLQTFVRDILKVCGAADFHKLIASFRWHGIASTNFDRTLESAYASHEDRAQTLVFFVKNGQPIEVDMKKTSMALNISNFTVQFRITQL